MQDCNPLVLLLLLSLGPSADVLSSHVTPPKLVQLNVWSKARVSADDAPPIKQLRKVRATVVSKLRGTVAVAAQGNDHLLPVALFDLSLIHI